jgi:hypothetical protein
MKCGDGLCCRFSHFKPVVGYHHSNVPTSPNAFLAYSCHTSLWGIVSCDSGEEVTECKWAGNVYFSEEVVSDGSPVELVSPCEEFKIGFYCEYPHRLCV